tara:strand:+ start:357 stop:1793 length:1437 start_codon:yes stop_codon:yes gene_type:complete
LKNRLRLAPSPTGLLHIGTARTALFNWLYAKRTNGQFLIRIEDTDLSRSKTQFTNNILEGLTWLGLNWDDEPIKQSDRIDLHQSIIKELIDKGIAYRCFMSENEAQELREKQNNNGLPPRYDNRHRNLSQREIESFIKQGRSSVIRFKIDDDAQITWQDQIRGKIKWLGKDLGGDMVLSRRANGYDIGTPLYNLAVVIDDNFMNITHVIRGEDHISNTAKQILIYEALNYKKPLFSHAPLILDSKGKKLSKRDSVTSIDEFKEMGYLPDALANYMVLLGWSIKPGTSEIQSIEEISNTFDINDINKAGAKFNWEKLNWINSQYIKKMDSKDLFKLFEKLWEQQSWIIPSQKWGLNLTLLVQDSIIVLKDVIDQTELFFNLPTIEQKELDFLKNNKSKSHLVNVIELIKRTNNKINSQIAKEIIDELVEKNGVKKGILMKSLRIAFFGCLSGPDLIESWVLFSEKEEDILRINRCLDIF